MVIKRRGREGRPFDENLLADNDPRTDFFNVFKMLNAICRSEKSVVDYRLNVTSLGPNRCRMKVSDLIRKQNGQFSMIFLLFSTLT